MRASETELAHQLRREEKAVPMKWPKCVDCGTGVFKPEWPNAHVPETGEPLCLRCRRERRFDFHVIQCNYAEGTSECGDGARAYLIREDPVGERCLLYARSRSGRWIEKWEAFWRLKDFRTKTIPKDHPLYDKASGLLATYGDLEESAHALSLMADGVRHRRHVAHLKRLSET